MMGNCTATQDPNYFGSWGEGSTISGFNGGVQANVGHGASTIAALLGVESPMPNDNSAIAVDGSTGKVTPLVGLENT